MPAKKLRGMLKTAGDDECSVWSEKLEDLMDGKVFVPPPSLGVPSGAPCTDSIGQPINKSRPHMRRPFRVLCVGDSCFNLRDPRSADHHDSS